MKTLSWKEYSGTKSKAEVLRQLQAMGYEITQRTFYRHCKNGQCRVNEEGLYSRRMLRQYIEAEGIRRTGETGNGDEGPDVALSVRKQELENEKLELANRMSELNYRKKKGKVLDREALYLEMASRTVALDNGFRQKIDIEAPALITAVGGKVSRQVEFVDMVFQIWDELLNSYAQTDEYEVLFQDEED